MTDTIKRLWKIWADGDLDFCLDLFKRYRDESEEEHRINEKMNDLGLIYEKGEPKLPSLFPAYHTGTAFHLARRYGISLNIGTHFGDCRAVLPRKKWINKINKNIPLESLAFFTVPESHDEIESFQGISDRPRIAICKCLIQARIAGVI